MSGDLIVAVPSKGRLKDQVEAWLADCGIPLRISGGARGYLATLQGTPGVQVRLLSAGDIAEALSAGEIHLGVTGEDLLRETGPGMEARILLLRALGFGRADLVVAAPKSWLDVDGMADLEEVAHDYLARTDAAPAAVAIPVSSEYRRWWGELEDCIGRHAPLAAQFYVVPEGEPLTDPRTGQAAEGLSGDHHEIESAGGNRPGNRSAAAIENLDVAARQRRHISRRALHQDQLDVKIVFGEDSLTLRDKPRRKRRRRRRIGDHEFVHFCVGRVQPYQRKK